ncbi:MAG TPA: DUF2461 domain-containing protein [Flavobacteriales bacterium]|nr:DUF2461 domain-containing protein [Flavobacteriales bacterium]
MAWFTNDFNDFFKDLAKNNNKEWFDANRKRYEASVKEPFTAFVAEAIKRIGKHDKAVRIEPKEAIFRINRDIRFSKDKTPYKLNASAIISPAGRKDHATPGIYFELGPESVKFYGGAYQPEKEQLERIRTAIMRDPKGFRKTIENKAFTALFDGVLGEANKVLPNEFREAAMKEPLIANKQFYVGAERSPKLVADPKLMDQMMDHYLAMRPFNAWLAAAMR